MAPTSAARATAEDRVLAVAGVLAAIQAREALASLVLALDTPPGDGSGPVTVTFDPAPADEAALADLPAQLAAGGSGWRAHWRSASTLVVNLPPSASGPPGGPLLAPILDHGRGRTLTRFLPLAAWRHLGIYGGDALGALHALLGSLLYAQPPSALALTILDHGAIGPLYRDVAHLVLPPASPRETLELLSRALRRGIGAGGQGAGAGAAPADPLRSSHPPRPLLLVVVEPDGTLLGALTALLTRLHQHPEAPLHLLLVQERLLPAGPELHALLPALITAGGQGAADWLPGQGAWPHRDRARLVGRGMRLEGRARTLDEAAIAALLAAVRGAPAGLPPVLWEVPAPSMSVALLSDPAAPIAAPAPLAPRVEQQDAASQPLDVPPRVDVAPAAAHEGTADPLAPAPPADTTPPPDLPWRNSAELLRATLERAARPTPAPLTAAVPPAAPPAPIDVPASAPEPDNGWPVGPPPLGRQDLAALLARVVTAPAVTAGQPDQIGLSKRRLAELLPQPQARAKALAEVLLVWFDQASLLAAPPSPDRFHHPRPLQTIDLATIAARLRATPLPDEAAVRAAWAADRGGAS